MGMGCDRCGFTGGYHTDSCREAYAKEEALEEARAEFQEELETARAWAARWKRIAKALRILRRMFMASGND